MRTCRECGEELMPGEWDLCGDCGVLTTFPGSVASMLGPGPDVDRLRAHAARYGLPDPGPAADEAAERSRPDKLDLLVDLSYLELPRRGR